MRAPRLPPEGPRRGQPRSLSARQVELLEMLEDLFLEEGFASVTLDDLASELRCSKVTLYTLAPSREQLILTVLKQFFDRTTELLSARVLVLPTTQDRVGAYLRCMASEMKRMSPACFHDVLSFATSRELYDRFCSDCYELLRQLLEERSRRSRSDMKRAAFLTEAVRVVQDDMWSGEFQARSGIADDEALRWLIGLVSVVSDSTTDLARPMKRIK